MFRILKWPKESAVHPIAPSLLAGRLFGFTLEQSELTIKRKNWVAGKEHNIPAAI